MFKCLENKYQLANILSYLSLNDILKFYRLNKSIKGKLSKETNPVINSFFYLIKLPKHFILLILMKNLTKIIIK